MYYLVVNSNSRSGKGKRIWRRLKKQLINSGVKYEVHLTEKPEGVSDFAAPLTEGREESRIIVAMNRNGTISEMLNGLAFYGPITLGYIPTSSGSDLARGSKLPKHPGRCLKKVLDPRHHRLPDYGVVPYGLEEVAHRRFAVSAGIGYDAIVCHDLLYFRPEWVLNKIHLGKLGYVLTGVKQLAPVHPTKGYLLLDGVQKVGFNHIYFTSAHIHPHEGSGFEFAPKAKPADGVLDIRVIHNAAKRKLAPILVSIYLGGRTNYRGVRHYICQEAGVHTGRTMPVHVDGESYYCQNDLQI